MYLITSFIFDSPKNIDIDPKRLNLCQKPNPLH